VRYPAFYLVFLWWFQEKAVTLSAVMNWKFILSWTVKFTLCLVVWNIAVYQTNSLLAGFCLALGCLILLAIAESYVIDWIEKWKENRK
jgi:hypothetical protein